MKAETLKQFLLNKYQTKDYFDCPVPKHHWEVIQEYAEQYARIQIEKDRERVAKALENENYLNENDTFYDKILSTTPIKID